MAKVISLRVPEDLLAWADEYAARRKVSRTDLLVQGLRSFRDDCERGVSGLPARVIPASQVEREAQAAERKRIEDAAAQEMRKAVAARQQRLNDAKYGRAS